MKLQLYIIAIMSAFTMSACTDVIELELDDPTPVLVVDGFISNLDTIQAVRLSSLENYFASEPADYSFYKSSKVTLRENTTEVGIYVFNDEKLRFELQYQGVEGKEYQVHIVLPDGSSYLSAAEMMQNSVPIDTIWQEYATADGPQAEKGDFVVKINTQEPPGLGDLYQWKSFVNGVYNFEAQDIFVSDDRFVDGQYVSDAEVYAMSNEEFQEHKANSANGRVIVTMQQTTINQRYFDYIVLVQQQLLQVGSPFASPPAEIRGNVYKEGEDEVLALGFFYTSSVDAASVELIEQ